MQPKKLSEFSEVELNNNVKAIVNRLANSMTSIEDDLHEKYDPMVANQVIFMALTEFYSEAIMFYVSPEQRASCIDTFKSYVLRKEVLSDVVGSA